MCLLAGHAGTAQQHPLLGAQPRAARRRFVLPAKNRRPFFYPDFLCRLPASDDQPGPVLAVEYKGADRRNDAEDNRLIGDLWANLSADRCRFVMVRDKRRAWIEDRL